MKIDASWKNPDTPGVQASKVMTLAIGQDLRNRRVVEDAFSLAFEQNSMSSVSASDVMPPNFADMDSAQIKAQVENAGADALATVRAVDVTTEQHWVPGSTYYPPYYGSYYGYHGYYGYGGYSSPGYMSETTKALLETNLWDARTGNLVWVGQSEFVVSGKVETLATKYATIVVKEMIAQGALVK